MMSIFSSLSASSAAAAHGSTFVSNRKVNSLRFQNSLAQVQVTKLPSEFKAKYSLEINARKSKTLKAASKRYKVTATGRLVIRDKLFEYFQEFFDFSGFASATGEGPLERPQIHFSQKKVEPPKRGWAATNASCQNFAPIFTSGCEKSLIFNYVQMF